MKILIVDDDRDLVELLAFALERSGFDVLPAYDAPTALKLLKDQQPDLAILDVNLGYWNGFDVLQNLRQHSNIPVVMLTGRDGADDKVRGLDLGADDYVTKPFNHRELVARIRAQLRRRGTGSEWSPPLPSEAVLHVGPIMLDIAQHTVTNDGHPVALTVTEFRLLSYLMAHAGTVVPTRVLLKQVWGYDDPTATDVVRVTVYRIRRKIEEDFTNPRLLHTVSGVGVMLQPKSP